MLQVDCSVVCLRGGIFFGRWFKQGCPYVIFLIYFYLMKLKPLALLLLFAFYSSFHAALPFEIVEKPVKTTVAKSSCCCKGRVCKCSGQAHGGCRTKSLKPTGTKTKVALLKGIGCEYKEKGPLASLFSKPYSLAATQSALATAQAIWYQLKPLNPLTSLNIPPLEKPPKGNLT